MESNVEKRDTGRKKRPGKYIPAMGGNKMAKRPRKISEEHIFAFVSHKGFVSCFDLRTVD